MAQVPATSYESTSLGDVAEFTIPFPFLSRAEVFVTVDGASVPFTWINDGLVQLSAVPELGAVVRRYRSTAAYVPLHQFSTGVPFLPRYVDRDFKQALYAVQESVNDTAGTAAQALSTAEESLLLVQDAFDILGERTQYIVLGPYGPNLNFQTTSQVFSYLGNFYSPGPAITLPYTTTGAGAGEIANFRNVGDAILRGDLADGADPAKGASLVGYKGRTVAEKLGEFVSVKDYGALGDGVTNDQPFIQSAINTLIAAGGGTLYFPPGTYKVNSQLLIDLSANATRFGGRIHILGAGMPSTCIKATGAFAAIRFKGAPTIYEAYFNIEGLRLEGPARLAGSFGIVADEAVAFCNFFDVCVEQFEIGIAATDMEQVGFYNCFVRFNQQGIVGNAASIATSPNSWSFYNTIVASNTLFGVQLTNPNAFNWNGGSVQYNGYIGAGAASWGVKLIEAGDGYGTVGFTNMVFEGNGGVGDFVSVQNTYACQASLDNVAFMRTVNFKSATVTGAANNGGGAIRLTLDSTAGLVGRPKVMITGVIGTTEANNATPWSFTIIDGTHIDLTGSTFTNAYVSGGIVTTVGFADSNILAAGVNATAIYSIDTCAFRSALGYLPSAGRPTVKLDNTGARIADNGSSYFQNAVEKLTYPQLQQIGDDGSAWKVASTTITAAGGTFTATGDLRVKKIGKTVHFQLDALTTSWAATPTGPMSFTVPFPALARNSYAAVNGTTLNSLVTVQQAGASTIGMWAQTGAFPVTANGQRVIVSGTYETTA